MLTVVATIIAKPDFVAQVRKELLKLVAPTRVEDGCINYDMHQCIDDPTRFVFYENWRDAAALEKHLDTPHLRAWREYEHRSGALAEPVRIERYRMEGRPAHFSAACS